MKSKLFTQLNDVLPFKKWYNWKSLSRPVKIVASVFPTIKSCCVIESRESLFALSAALIVEHSQFFVEHSVDKSRIELYQLAGQVWQRFRKPRVSLWQEIVQFVGNFQRLRNRDLRAQSKSFKWNEIVDVSGWSANKPWRRRILQRVKTVSELASPSTHR